MEASHSGLVHHLGKVARLKTFESPNLSASANWENANLKKSARGARRAARIESGLTQVETGKRLRKPQAYLSKIERGERGVDAIELAELAKVYKKSLDYFVN